jgi:SNF2 family DNA or RNA helicase
MIKVLIHPRGLSISTDKNTSQNSLIRRIEERVGADQLLVYRGQLILPSNLAGDVLELLDTDEVSWDESLLRQAREQAEHRRMQLRARVEVAQAIENPNSILGDYELLSKLDSHQLAAVAAISVISLKGLALFDEQGTGKTIVALAAFNHLKRIGKVHRLLVIAPKSVLGAWKTDCKLLFDSAYRVGMVAGSSFDRRRVIQSLHDILLVSYDSAVRERGLIKMIVAAKPADYMLVVDESYFVKNPKTARAQVVASLRPFCERAVVLCGTPAPNSATDIVNQIEIADGGVAFGRRSISKDSEEAVVEIAEALDQTIYLRRLKEDTFPNLPTKEFERVLVNLRPTQRSLYERARDQLVLAVRSVDDREFTRRLSSFLAKRVTLLQICSNPSTIDPLHTEEPAKLLALDRLLHELIEEQNKKVVIWSFFRGSLQAIVERYRRFGLVRIDGSVLRVEDRIEAINRFQNDEKVRLFVGNAAAAGAGITLTAAHHAIYESFSNQAAHYMQSVDRIHRRGQTQNVINHILLARNTIETREFNRILEKESAGRDLLGDRYKELITRDRFLADLGTSDD